LGPEQHGQTQSDYTSEECSPPEVELMKATLGGGYRQHETESGTSKRAE
jgi:hypothetical protein